MTTVADVGDAIELIFTTVPGATVTMSWLNPAQVPVLDGVNVPENPPVSGKFPYTFPLTAPDGVWTAQFAASGTTTVVERYYVRVMSLTGPPPFAAVGDVQAQLGTMTAAQQSLAAWLIRAASAMLRGRLPLIDQQIAAGLVSREMAALVVSNMVLRVMRNPNGLRAETTGPFSRTYDTTTAAGLLVLTDYDLATVTPAEVVPDGLAALGIGTIRVTPGLMPTVHRHRWGGPHAGC
jgi:hypothetical protein